MEKLVYLLRRPPAQTREVFRSELLGETARVIEAAGARALTLNVADVKELPTIVHMSDPDALLGASVSIWLDNLDARAPIEERLRAVSDRVAGYLVTESTAREYTTRDWADGERSPGVTLVAVFPIPDRLDEETFFEKWHGSHTPLSLEIHPLTRYIRNTIARVLTSGAPAYRAHVEERVRELADLSDPARFYGSPEAQKRAFEDLESFCDLEQMHTAIMSEYIVRSGP